MKRTFYKSIFSLLLSFLFTAILIQKVQAQNLIISGGNDYSMAVCDDGKIKTWGNVLQANGQKQIVTKPTDVQIPSDLKFSQADAGSGYHVVALDCQQRVWAFGENGNGQLGRSPDNGSSTPLAVPGVGGVGQLSGAQYVTGANRASFAILADGRVVGWGQNGDGQLGRGNTTQDFVPNYVLKAANTPLTNIFQVDAGDETVYALDGDGFVWAWGSNQNAALGRKGGGTPYAKYVLKQDSTPLNNIIMISGGDKHGLALSIDGTVWSWGGNWGRGQLGNGDANGNDQPYAAQVLAPTGETGFLKNATYIAAGQASSMVVLRNGNVVTFGSNALFLPSQQKAAVGGNLGHGSTNPTLLSLVPDYVQDCSGNRLANILYISDADAVTYAMTRNGDVFVMGGNTNGELGLENMTASGCATKLDLTVKYSCGLPDQCPDPNLGPDIPVCTTADLTNITISVAGFRTYAYTWYYRNNSGASFTELTGVPDTNLIKPDKLGQYMVKVERASNNCTTCKPGYDTITVDQANSKVTQFCQPNNTVLNFSVEGNGDYAWYKSLTGNDALPPNGKTKSINMNELVPEVSGDDSTYSLYVQDMKVYSGLFVSPNIQSNNIYPAGNFGRVLFNVYNTLTINSISVMLINYDFNNSAVSDIALQVLDPNGVQLSQSTLRVNVTGGVPNSTPFVLTFGASGLTLNPATGYTLRFTSSNTNVSLALYDQSTTYPVISAGEIEGRISITGIGLANAPARGYPGFVNWDIKSTGGGFPCGRLRVSMTRFCPCSPPKISLTSSSNALNFCDNGVPSSMVLTVTPDPATPPTEAYRYQWYKNDGIIGGSTGNQNTLTVNSGDLGTYSVRVGHTSVLRTRCYDDTTFQVALQKPIAANLIAGNDTVCGGRIPSQKVGVGNVVGGLAPTTYQWVSSTTGTAPWANVASDGNAVNYQPGNTDATTYFRRVVTSKGVCPFDTSNAVRTYVTPGSTPGTVIASAPVICENTSVTITTTPPIGGLPEGFKYRWSTTVNGTENALAGEVGASLISSTFKLTSTTTFNRYVSSAGGGCEKLASVTVSVDRNVTGNSLTSGTDQLKCEGSATDPIIGSTPGDNGKAPSYQWSSASSPNGPFIEIPSATAKDLNPTIVTSTTYFKRIVTSSGVCKNDTSIDVARVVVDPTVTAGSIAPANELVCSGSAPIINNAGLPTGGTPPFKYIWEYSHDGTNWNVISGYEEAGPLLVAPSISANALYRRTVQSTKCSATATTTDTIKVIGSMSGGQVRSTKVDLCPGEVPGVIENVAVGTGGTGNKITYQWQISTDGGNTFANLSGSSTDSNYVPTSPLSVSSIFRRRAANGTGPCDTAYASTSLIIQYQPQNPGTISDQDTTVCIGSNIKVFEKEAVTFGSPDKTYSWMVSYEPFTTWQALATNEKELSVPNIQVSTKFRRVVSDKCHPGDTSANVFTVNVLNKTIPTISFDKNFTSDIFCNNGPLTVTVSTIKAGLGRRIEWVYDGNSRSPLPDSILTLGANELVNGAKIKVILTSDPTLFCTETTTESAEMTVNVDSKIQNNSITSNPQNLCFSSLLDTIRANSSLGTLGNPAYKWQTSTDNSNWLDIANSNTTNTFPTKVLGNTYYRRITYSAGTCPNDTTARYRVFMDSLVNSGKIQALSAFQCQGDSVVINSAEMGSGGTGRIRYSWEFSRDRDKWFPVPGAKDSVGLFIPDKYVLDNTETIIKFYFKRTAISGAGLCFTQADTVGVTVCQDPVIPFNLSRGSECAGDTLKGDVIQPPGDYSPNGGVLFVDSFRSFKGASVSVTGNTYSYIPLSPTFVGRDTVEFTIKDQFTQRSKKKYLYINYYPVNHAPIIVTDLLSTYRNQTISGVNILSNDTDPDGDTLYVNLKPGAFIKLPKFGEITIDSTGELSYVPQRDLALRETVYDTAVFTVCDYSKKKYCNDFFCKLDTVIFEIKPYRIFVPEGFSPNDDGVNDYFVIRSEVPLDIEVQIYNRWGNLVFEDKNYKNDWNGRANRGLVIGDGVPDGTYYLHYNVHDTLMEPGFMYITISR